MNKIVKVSIFGLLALMLLAPWPIAYAHTFDGAMARQDAVHVQAAEASALPTWTAFGKVIGGVTPGDLFYIDATDNPADIVATLYINNAWELIGCYRNLILKVGIYAEGVDGEWEEASMGNGEPISDTFITMRNSQVSYILAGLAKYKITIDDGSFYCVTISTYKGSLSPQFYLEVD